MSFDVSRSDNPRVSSLLDLILVQVFKADDFDFYAINYRPYGLPINRPHSLNNPLSRLFFFAIMRSEGLRFDLSIFPLRVCVPMNSKNSNLPCFLNSKFSCFPLIFSKDYHCQVISRSKSIALSAFMDVP